MGCSGILEVDSVFVTEEKEEGRKGGRNVNKVGSVRLIGAVTDSLSTKEQKLSSPGQPVRRRRFPPEGFGRVSAVAGAAGRRFITHGRYRSYQKLGPPPRWERGRGAGKGRVGRLGDPRRIPGGPRALWEGKWVKRRTLE